MKEVKTLLFLLLLQSMYPLYAQQSRSYATVLKYLDGQTTEKFRMIPTCIDGNGDVLVAGISGITDKNITVRKLNPQGALIWEYTFDSDNHGDDWASDIDTDDQGNVYVCGSVVEKNPDKQLALLIKISPTGSLLWKKEKASLSQNTGGFFSEHGEFYHFTKIVLNKQQSKLAIAGNSSSSPYIDHILDANLQQTQDSIYTTGSYEVYKFDGNMIKASSMWMAGLNDKKSYSTDVCISSGTFFVSATVQNFSDSSSVRIFASALTQQGNLWRKDFPAQQYAYPYTLEAKGQYLYVAASMDLSVASNRDFAVLKIDKNNGALQWIYTLNGSTNTTDDAAKDIIIQGNDVFACGEVNNNVALVKLNPNGLQKMKSGFFGDEKFQDKKSRVSGMVYANGYFWVSGFASAPNKAPNQFVIPFNSEGDVTNTHIFDMGMDANSQISFPIIQSKNIAVDSLGSIWVLGVVKNQNNSYSYPVYRITDFYKEILPVQTDISARADTFAMALASLSQDPQIQALVTSFMFNSGKETLTLSEFEFLYPDLSLKMSESLAKFGLSGTEISNFMTNFRSWHTQGYNLTPYISIPQVDTVTFDYLCWDRVSVSGVAKFAGRKDSIPLYTLDSQYSANIKSIYLVSVEDFNRFWAKPVWQMGIEFKDMYNNQIVDLYSTPHDTIGFRPHAKCACKIKTWNDNGVAQQYAACEVDKNGGCGRETTNAGSNNCSGLDNCIRLLGAANAVLQCL